MLAKPVLARNGRSERRPYQKFSESSGGDFLLEPATAASDIDAILGYSGPQVLVTGNHRLEPPVVRFGAITDQRQQKGESWFVHFRQDSSAARSPMSGKHWLRQHNSSRRG